MGSMSSRRPSGTNLFELIFAVSFCALALFAVVGVQTRYQVALQKDEAREQGRNICLSQQATAADALSVDFIGYIGYPRRDMVDYPDYDSEIVVEPNDPTNPTLKKVTVTVWWTDKNGEQKASLWCYYDPY
jgi:hypothetical protein